MTFGEAVSSVLKQYAGFTGRARRSEYWYFALFNALVLSAVRLLAALLNAPLLSLLVVLVGLVFLLPGLAVTARRLHDTGRTGWLLLLGIIPLAGTIALLVFTCMDSDPGPNRFGPSPKEDVRSVVAHRATRRKAPSATATRTAPPSSHSTGERPSDPPDGAVASGSVPTTPESSFAQRVRTAGSESIAAAFEIALRAWTVR